jgi:hypothetical protein
VRNLPAVTVKHRRSNFLKRLLQTYFHFSFAYYIRSNGITTHNDSSIPITASIARFLNRFPSQSTAKGPNTASADAIFHAARIPLSIATVSETR